MACLQMHNGVITDHVIHKQHSVSNHLNEQSGAVNFPNLSVKPPNLRISTSVNAAVTSNSALSLSNHTSIDTPRVSETFDEWMRKSVTEIVKNITQAPLGPLLVQIYADGEMKTKKAEKSNDWKNKNKTTSSLEGVILVEELINPAVSSDRVFGVLIQGKVKGRGGQCKSTCYLLKTTSSVGGLGIGCTHFCLMKVKSFHQSVFSQFRDCWLV